MPPDGVITFIDFVYTNRMPLHDYNDFDYWMTMSLKRKSCLLLSAVLCFLPSMAHIPVAAGRHGLF